MMNEEEKELVEGIKQYPTHRELCLIHVIERLDEELDKKDKVINLAIKNLNQLGGMYHLKAKDNTYSSRNVESVKMTVEEIKEYFYKKVEEENESQNR